MQRVDIIAIFPGPLSGNISDLSWHIGQATYTTCSWRTGYSTFLTCIRRTGCTCFPSVNCGRNRQNLPPVLSSPGRQHLPPGNGAWGKNIFTSSEQKANNNSHLFMAHRLEVFSYLFAAVGRVQFRHICSWCMYTVTFPTSPWSGKTTVPKHLFIVHRRVHFLAVQNSV
jgi:hypothetical protein